MKARAFMPHLIAGLLLLAGCSGKAEPEPYPQPDPVTNPAELQWTFMPGGIEAVIAADPDLNVVGGESHAVSLCLYQVRKLEATLATAATQDGLRELLRCDLKRDDVVQATRVYVQPGETATLRLDRAEGARCLVAVAGFNDLQPGTSLAAAAIPVHVENVRVMLMLSSEKHYSPSPMTARIFLGGQTIHMKGFERVR